MSETNANMSLDAQALLDVLPLDGSGIGYRKIAERLDWDDADTRRLYEARNQLIDLGIAKRGRGRGGSVARIDPAEFSEAEKPDYRNEPEVEPVSLEATTPREQDLYNPILSVLREHWVHDQRFDRFDAQITAQQGRRQTGGRWTRPDLVVVAESNFEFLPSQFDLVTFEVKTTEGLDVTAVYEAVAHLRAATLAFVLAEAPHDMDGLEEVASEAGRHGIGLIVASEVDDYESWDTMVEPVRHEPDRHRLDEFIHTQLPVETHSKLRRQFTH